MKEKIIQALKTKYKNLGFSDKAFDGVATYLTTSVTEEAQIETAIGGVEGMLKTFQGELDTLRGGKSQAEKAVEELRKKINELGGKQEPTPPNNGGANEIPAWAKELIESNKSLTAELNTIKGEKVANSRKEQLDKVIAVLPEQFRKPYERMSFNGVSDEDFATQLESIKTEAEGLATEMKQKGMVFSTPTPGNGIDEKKGVMSESDIKSMVGESI